MNINSLESLVFSGPIKFLIFEIDIFVVFLLVKYDPFGILHAVVASGPVELILRCRF